ncbi:hypothetical protein Tco_1370541 [Tanacetum coccineum]
MGMGTIPTNWMDIVEKVADLPCSNTIRSILRRIILATFVYYIWKERNSRLFTNNKVTAQDNIRLQLLSLKVKDSAQVKLVATEWNIKMNYIKNTGDRPKNG